MIFTTIRLLEDGNNEENALQPTRFHASECVCLQAFCGNLEASLCET